MHSSVAAVSAPRRGWTLMPPIMATILQDKKLVSWSAAIPSTAIRTRALHCTKCEIINLVTLLDQRAQTTCCTCCDKRSHSRDTPHKVPYSSKVMQNIKITTYYVFRTSVMAGSWTNSRCGKQLEAATSSAKSTCRYSEPRHTRTIASL